MLTAQMQVNESAVLIVYDEFEKEAIRTNQRFKVYTQAYLER